MASDAQGINVGSSTADRENEPPFDYLKIFISFAIVCLCAIPGFVLFYRIGLIQLQCSYVLMILLCFPENWRLRKQARGSSKGIAGIYYKSQMKPSVIGRLFMSSSRLLARTGVLLSWWLALNVLVPKFKKMTLLGSPLWTWSLLAFALPSSYFIAISLCLVPLLIRLLVALIFRQRGNPYVYHGLFGNAVLVLYLGILLSSWVGYFGTESGLKHPSIPHLGPIFDHVTWICVSLLVGSVLWFVKSCIVMVWSLRAIYRRFESRILMTTVKFMYLGLMVGGFFVHNIMWEMELVEEYVRHSASQEYSFQKYIMSKHAGATHLDLVSQYLISLAKFVEPLEDEGLPKLLDYLGEKISATTDTCQLVHLVKLIGCRDLSDRNLKRLKGRRMYRRYGLFVIQYRRIFENPPTSNLQTMQNRDTPIDVDDLQPGEYRNNIANVLHRLVQEQCPSVEANQFTFDDLKRWMVDAHLNCVNMGRTLADASAIVTHLDIIISIIIFALVVLLWLLISGIATTKVLVTIGTPLLAFTFIFGDSAKTFFQGIIFCFGTHSFDVGDRCILDDTELEVERMGILTTKFIKIGTKERRLYPNAVLATKAIINKGWEPDPSDSVELKLEMSTFRKQWGALESTLKSFFNDDEHRGNFQSSYEETMEEIDDKIKVIIHFKHVLNVKEMTHNQCFQKKKRQRSTILKSITQFLEPSDNSAPVNSGRT